MKSKRIIGLSLVFLSVFALLFNLRITGAVIGTNFPIGLNFIALVFLIVGLVFFINGGLERNLAQEKLESGAVITDPKKIKKIAKKMGYDSGREVREGYEILDDSGKPITVIPNHQLSRGVYKNIMKSLSTGESNFRNYNRIVN